MSDHAIPTVIDMEHVPLAAWWETFVAIGLLCFRGWIAELETQVDVPAVGEARTDEHAG